MNSTQKGKAFERWDRDGVAQHRNIMHEITMKKQITMYQREEKLLEKELREISKVKETLKQIRAPLRRRVQAAEMEENLVESSGTERNLRKTSVTGMRKISVGGKGFQQTGTNRKLSETTQREGAVGMKNQTLSVTVSDRNSPLTPSPNIRQRKISVLERPQQNTPLGMAAGGHRFAQRKISAPAFSAGRKQASEESGKSGFLPVIKTPNPPPDLDSPAVKRKSLLLDRPLSATKNDEVEYRTRSPAMLTPIAPSKVDMAVVRAKSVPCELPSQPISTPRGRPRQLEAEEVTTLTMEETLRIKGKFRQIGHSVIATALLKGLRQKRQLSSEAIHNMHKPIFLGEEGETKNSDDQNDNVEGGFKEQGEEKEEFKQDNNKKSFRNIARKTINVNRMLNVTNSRSRSQSNPEKHSTAAAVINSRPKSVSNPTGKGLDKATGQEMTNSSAQSKDSRSNGIASAGVQRRNSATEFKQDANNMQQDTESENSPQTQQMYNKQSVDVDPFRPLMNPRTAHARRRKNTLTNALSGDVIKELIEQSQNSSGDVEPQITQTDDQSGTGQKTVRFASDAWT